MILYQQFFRKFGIRKAEHLLTPPLPNLELLELPVNSILHYVTTSPIEVGPPSDDFLFRNIKHPIMMEHITANGDSKGVPRLLPIVPLSMVRQFHIRNKRFRLMRNLESAGKNPSVLVVYNYGVIPHLYRYVRSFYTDYYKWWNTQAAVWKNMDAIANASHRQQYVVCKLPTVLPSVSDLKLAAASKDVTQRIVKVFSSPESLMLLEIWKWLGEDRTSSILNNLSDESADRVNLIYQESGKWFCLNLGVINSWRIATKEELALNPYASVKGIAPDQIQRRFLRLMISLFQVRTVANVEQAPKAETSVAQKSDELQPQVIKQTSVLPEIDKQTGAVIINTGSTELPEEARHDDDQDYAPDDTGDDIAHTQELEDMLDKDLSELEEISKRHVEDSATDELTATDEVVIVEPDTLEDGVMEVCDKFADAGLISAAEYRRFTQLATSYKHIVSPDGVTTLDKYIDIKPEDLKIEESYSIPDIKTVYDKTMLKSSLHTFDEQYIKKVLKKDIASMVLNVQYAGIAVTGYETETIDNVNGSSILHSVRVVPVDGTSSTIRFTLPAIEEDGTYRANGVKYKLRKQRGDAPIRKIAPNKVALTSYYGKVFIGRNTKRVNDYGQWLCNNVMLRGLSAEDTTITDLHPFNVFDNSFVCPKLYSILSMNFKSFTTGDYSFMLDNTKREEMFGKEAIKAYEKNGSVIIGKNIRLKTRGDGPLGTDVLLVVDKNNTLYSANHGALTEVGTFEDLIKLDTLSAPVDFSELKVLGKSIPIGIILAYELGLDKLIRLLKVTPRRVQAGARVGLAPHEYSLVFSDETLVFSKDDKEASMILAGFNDYHKEIRSISVYEFDRKPIYHNVLNAYGISARYLRELDNMYQLFIDPITKELLVEMKEPTTFHGLLRRSTQMLLNDQHPDELDPAFMRIKGYERMAGAVYGELVRSIRAHSARVGRSRHPIDMNPQAVWMNIARDPSVQIVNDINPIENLKQQEAVTYAGTGGRNSRSMTKKTRSFHRNDMGTMSESTSDSGDVAINTYTSADPQFTSLRGMSKRYRVGKTGATALLSTSALVSVGAEHDDPKRINFIGIQHSHGVSCGGYTQAPVRTGYEQVIPHRTSDLFAFTAKKPGKVVSVTDTGIVIEYKDGERKGIEIGRRYGEAAGLTIPHEVVADVKEGQSFKDGDLICHNSGFFEKDLLNPNNVVWKSSVLVKTALLESTATLEDSSAVSKRVANLLSTKTTKVKNIVVSFDQSIRKLVKTGDKVEAESILCIIEDAVTANTGAFDDETLDTLRVLSAQTPQAKAKGVVERIEVYYHGDKEDMSEALRAIANASDKELSARHSSIGRKAFTGSVDLNYRVTGDALLLDTAVIKVFITSDIPLGVGDKGVFCNQMKTVFGEVMTSDIKTESGKLVDGIFGATSIAARIVESPFIIGTTTTLLDVIGKKAVEIYRGK